MDPEITLLKAAEAGCELLYYGMAAQGSALEGTGWHALYSSTYTLWTEKAAEQYRQMQWLNTVYDQCIVGHEEAAPDVFVTTYENNVQVAVNYSDKTVTVQGSAIEAGSFAVWGGGNS